MEIEKVEQLDYFIELLKTSMKDSLVGVMLYGSSLDQNSSAFWTDIDLIVALSGNFRIDDLKRIRNCLAKYSKTYKTSSYIVHPPIVIYENDNFLCSSPFFWALNLQNFQIAYQTKLLPTIINNIKSQLNDYNLKRSAVHTIQETLINVQKNYMFNWNNPREEFKYLKANFLIIFRNLAFLRDGTILSPSHNEVVDYLISNHPSISSLFTEKKFFFEDLQQKRALQDKLIEFIYDFMQHEGATGNIY